MNGFPLRTKNTPFIENFLRRALAGASFRQQGGRLAKRAPCVLGPNHPLRFGFLALATAVLCATAPASSEAANGSDGLSPSVVASAESGKPIASRIAAGINRGNEAAGLDEPQWGFDGLKVRLFNLGTASRDILQRLSEEARLQVAAMEQIIERTGLDVDDLLAHLGSWHQGSGGPFVAAPPSTRDDADPMAGDASLNADLMRWDLLRDVVRSLPLAEPIAAYEVSSRFGRRADPFNRRMAVHQGLDFVAPLKTPVVATASGTVVFADWKGSYGRLVEISHGPRVVTRYAHLAKILVKEGETVRTGDRIGLLGSSGRSSGPHLHYEVLFDDVHRDPMMFIQAGRSAPLLAMD